MHLKFLNKWREILIWKDTAHQLVSSYQILLLKLNLKPRLITKKKIIQYNNLLQYIEEGNYPRNDITSSSKPIFVDRSGNLCAIAALLNFDSEVNLMQEIKSTFNLEYVENMKNEDLDHWLKKNDLTLEEAVTIQPQYSPVTSIDLRMDGLINLVILVIILAFGISIARELVLHYLWRKKNIKKLQQELKDKKSK